MSFNKSVKEEILQAKLPMQSARAFLSALTHTSGSIGKIDGQLGFEISCETKSIIQKASKLIKELYGVNLKMYWDNSTSPNNATLYYIKCYDENSTRILEDLRIIDLSEGLEVIFGIDEGLFIGDYDEKAYIQGAFLGCGSVTIPKEVGKNAGYHLEFAFNNGIMADDFASLILRCGFNPKFINRKEKCLIYMKDNESIIDILAFMEAMKSVLKVNEIIVEREMRNLINRQTNCEMANIDRAVSASEKQLSAISEIRNSGEFDMLPEKLREFAIIREKNKELSLEELGNLFNPPLSKSGVNHRMRKIMQIAKEIKN